MSLSIFDAAARWPDAEALVVGGERLGFRVLAARAHARITELTELGVRPLQSEPVALLADGSLILFELLYALLALGVPVLPLHPRLTAPERALLRETAGATLSIEPSRALCLPADTSWPEAPSALAVPEQQALALVATSGSSGTPKLVELSRRAFLALAAGDAQRIGARATDRALLCLPLSHVGGLSVVIRALVAGRPCVVFDAPRGLLQAVPELADCLARERITLLSLVPPVLSRLLREAPNFCARAPLRAVLIGGQACAPELFAAAQAERVPILTSYGLTEACSQVTTLGYPPPGTGMAVQSGVVSSGFPLPGVEIRVRSGLVEVRGPTLLTRYVGLPPPLNADGFFETGDRGEFDAKLGLFVRGRQSELIVTGGENVDPVEVEHALLACGGLSAACVFGIDDREFGQRIAVALEPAPGAALDEARLFQALDTRLASFKQPRVSCVVSELPRLASGKLDRAGIRLQFGPQLGPVKR